MSVSVSVTVTVSVVYVVGHIEMWVCEKGAGISLRDIGISEIIF